MGSISLSVTLGTEMDQDASEDGQELLHSSLYVAIPCGDWRRSKLPAPVFLYSKNLFNHQASFERRWHSATVGTAMGNALVQAAVASALEESFPFVRAFHCLDTKRLHFLASNQPIVSQSARELAQRMPSEWLDSGRRFPHLGPSLGFQVTDHPLRTDSAVPQAIPDW